MKRIVMAVVACVVVVTAVAAAAIAASSGVTNGGFESGTFAPWSTINAGDGAWRIDDGSGRGTPTSCATFDNFAGPVSGAFDALYDQSNPTSAVLYQDVVVPTDATMLTFALAWENDAGGWIITPGSAFDVGSDNQWISVDVLKAGADPETFDSGDIIKTVVRLTGGTSDLFQPWTSYSVGLAGYAGQKVRLRFAAADVFDCMPFAVDNVRFASTAAQDERIAYCSVAGDTWPDGTAIPPGTFLNLLAGQPASEAEYAGATPASYVAGTGLTCDPPPAGYTQQGYAGDAQQVARGVYPYYAPPPS